ncbi:Tripartite tricarboxylate transporter TctB family protein [Alteribacillus persepolensis]|uniref:Tripartite tricarboxylate transporter TctB family protein n=1 Tax=Alteribacillus persepolensis TaxID=568899 RepID=A0A1G8AYI8_9BACI|nr:tripartite tricarboxylate transporter TctB family protein [Alteribacillus persepolensis]SDH25430.1 Tripartite tricarboxylate transporter TctB family protein [Alteribacillus persepolensis]
MSQKKATYVVLIVLILIGARYWMQANDLSGAANQDTIGPGYFPNVLSIALFVLCGISFLQTLYSKDEEKIELPSKKLLAATIMVTVLFVASVSTFGFFYLQTFLFLLVLFTIYRFSTGMNVRIVAANAAMAFGLSLFFYVVFDLVMTVRF